ncbi:hypothetical protein C6P46_006246 [Rhodotorula mucilaginosa]|uniref:Homeobox domain-containing protein n=1 Tax=Rhodotorula mucilaginosa TaxID=5537 RepID=A0A9P7B3U5_RHOMI|nr:hypothetical protein C6P46_006246 [Rhodotorula mucilaginosa]TKA55756.1 hypothetical protein B0A53_02892 [Rhodotorula sp. CCFEE 5036]
MAAAVPALPSAAPDGAASGGRSTPPAASTSSTAATAAAEPPTHSSSPVRANGGHRMSIAALADVTEQVFGSPNALPGPPPAHFFPSVSRQDRERLQQARLARGQQQSAPPSTGEYDKQLPGALRRADDEVAGAAAGDATDEEQLRRERQAKLDLAATGPFDNRRPPHHQHPAASQHAEAAFGPGSLEGTSEAEEAAIRTLQAGTAAGRVGAGGSGGTKRRFRDVDRTSWDAASELVRFEREQDLADRNGAASDKSSAGTLQSLPFPTQDREKTPTPNTLLLSAAAKGKGRAVEVGDFDQGDPNQGADFDAHRRDSRMTDVSMPSEASEAEDDEDDASVMTGATRQSAGGNGSDGSGKEPAKKRSRTLTTPAQTAVLNALLAKTRFPSTETREEVGRQIGMSARRVQIWFQNRRQSQKRQREREAQEELATTRAARAMISAQAHHMVGYPVRVHTTYDPAQGGYVRAAQFYPPLQPKPAGPTEYVLINNEPRPAPSFETYQMVSAQPIEYAAAGQPQVMVPISPGDPRYPPAYVTTTTAAAPAYYDEHGRLVQTSQGPVRVVPQQQRVASHQQPEPSFPSKLYFPHVPRQAPAPHMSYRAGPPPPPLQPAFETAPRPQPDRNNSVASSAGGGDVRLPSLSSVFAASNNNDSRDELPDPRAYRPAGGLPSAPPTQGEHAPMFSHSPFSPPPAAHATIPMQAASIRQPAAAPPHGLNSLQSRAVFSPEPASSFERLRISGEPVQAGGFSSAAGVDERSYLPWPAMERPPTGGTARRPYSRDILDVAVEAMADQSSRALPPRHVLPPLRSVFGDNSFADDRNKSGAQSEADQALMAPIRPPTDPSSSSGGERGQRVNSISSIAAGTPVSPSGFSTLSNASRTTLSTAASFDFGRPPANSYRASREQECYDATGGPALVHSNSGSTISPEKQNGTYVGGGGGGGSEYPQTAADEEEPEFWRNRGDSVGTGETSLSSADAHSIPAK